MWRERVLSGPYETYYPLYVEAVEEFAEVRKAIGRLRDMLTADQVTAEQSAALVRVFTRHVRDTDHLDFRNMGFIDWIQRDVAKTILMIP